MPAIIFHPLPQAELEAFKEQFGRPAQQTLLYRWARLIELVYACKETLELLTDTAICGKETRFDVTPKAGREVGHVDETISNKVEMSVRAYDP